MEITDSLEEIVDVAKKALTPGSGSMEIGGGKVVGRATVTRVIFDQSTSLASLFLPKSSSLKKKN